MKINMGNQNDDDNKNAEKDLDYLYSNYKPSQSPVYYRGPKKKKGPGLKWVSQLIVAAAIFLFVWGLFKTQVPYGDSLKNGVRYLLNSETDVQPLFYRVIQMASQIGNLEWPVMDDPLNPTQPDLIPVQSEPALALPVSGSVTKLYGWLEDPQDKIKTFHEGIDISVPAGTVVKASVGGIVAATGEKPYIGQYVLIENENGDMMRYACLSEIDVKKGESVQAGDPVGKSGSAEEGDSHLHFEVIVDGYPTDPLGRLGR